MNTALIVIASIVVLLILSIVFYRHFFKRFWDIVLSGLAIIILSPTLLVEYLPRYSPEQRRRHDVRPGFTGLAQVHGRNSISWEEKFNWDIKYVDSISFFGDIKIIFDTVLVVFKRQGISSDTSVTMEEYKGSNSSERK